MDTGKGNGFKLLIFLFVEGYTRKVRIQPDISKARL